MGIDEWVTEVTECLREDRREPNRNDILIHCVPQSLSNTKTEGFYVPQVMTIGPYHFKPGSNVRLDELESLKSEVWKKLRRTMSNGSESVIESFKSEEILNDIKSSYVKEFPFAKNVWALMIARDACFLVEVLLRFLERHKIDESNAMPGIDSMLSRKRHHPLLSDILKDMFKMENQIPFWTLEKIRVSLRIPEKDDEGFNWFESSLKNLSPVEVGPVPHRVHTKTQILQLLHDFIVDKPTLHRSEHIKPKRALLHSMVSSLSLIWKTVICILLLFLFPLFIIWLLWHWLMLYCRRSDILIDRRGSVPTAEELKRVGVKFNSLRSRGIHHIIFKTNSSTLYLPKFNVDDRCEVILRNLMALEICSEQEEKPIARYVILMNDLINTSRDVAILRREDIITHKLGSDDEVAQLWNSIIVSSSTEVPYFPINEASSKINIYIKKWWKVLWAQFQMAHCSKPWLVLSLLAGISLLLLTLVQVVCLFHSCLLK